MEPDGAVASSDEEACWRRRKTNDVLSAHHGSDLLDFTHGVAMVSVTQGVPPKSTVFERFQYLVAHGFFERLVKELSDDLVRSGSLDLEECFIDGTFVIAKKGGRDRDD